MVQWSPRTSTVQRINKGKPRLNETIKEKEWICFTHLNMRTSPEPWTMWRICSDGGQTWPMGLRERLPPSLHNWAEQSWTVTDTDLTWRWRMSAGRRTCHSPEDTGTMWKGNKDLWDSSHIPYRTTLRAGKSISSCLQSTNNSTRQKRDGHKTLVFLSDDFLGFHLLCLFRNIQPLSRTSCWKFSFSGIVSVILQSPCAGTCQHTPWSGKKTGQKL